MTVGKETRMRVRHRITGQRGWLVSQTPWYAAVKFDGDDYPSWVALDSIAVFC